MSIYPRSLLPSMLSRNWWELWDYPARIMDQHFGQMLQDEDLLEPRYRLGYILRPRCESNIAKSGRSEVKLEPTKMKIMLNVKHFKPDELSVKVVDDYVVVHGKHEETADEHGYISREFTRRYMLPESALPESVSSSMGIDGILTVEVPRTAPEVPVSNERLVPITMVDPNIQYQSGDASRT